MDYKILTHEARKLIEVICKTEEFIVYETTISEGSCKGDGYSSKLLRVTIKGITKFGNKKTVHLILKMALPGEKYRKAFNVSGVFKRELDIYQTILPDIEKFQRELGISQNEQFRNCCKFYGGSTKFMEEVVIMENLTKCGYEVWNRKSPMTYHIQKMVVQTIGRFHALSFAMRKKKPKLFQKLAKSVPDIFVPTIKDLNYTSMIYKNLDEAKKSLDPIKDYVVLKRFNKLCENSWEFYENLMKEASSGNYAVIGHGDVWCNNIMFKFLNSGKPSDIRLLDWQLARLSSPVLDLSYFLLPNLRHRSSNKLDELLQEYYKSFSMFLRQLGCDPDILFPFRVLQSHWKQYCVYGLIMACILLKMMLVDEKDAPDFAELSEDDKDLTDAFSNINGKEKEFNAIIKEVIYYCAENNYM